MLNYNDVDTASKDRGETGDCTIKALAIACQVDYSLVWQIADKKGRKMGTGLDIYAMQDIARELGFDFDRIRPTGKTMITVTDGTRYNQNYLAFVRGHVAAIVHNKVEDWTNGRRHQVLIQVRMVEKTTKLPNPISYYDMK
jgi:hypothetical protein